MLPVSSARHDLPLLEYTLAAGKALYHFCRAREGRGVHLKSPRFRVQFERSLRTGLIRRMSPFLLLFGPQAVRETGSYCSGDDMAAARCATRGAG